MTQFAVHLVVQDVAGSVAFYQDAFGARLLRELHLPNGAVVIADLEVQGVPVALAAPVPGSTLATPASTSTSAAAYRLTVTDADAAWGRAVDAGATAFSPVRDAFWGVRTGEVLDPSGHRWAFDQLLREVPVAEIEAQLAAMVGGSER